MSDVWCFDFHEGSGPSTTSVVGSAVLGALGASPWIGTAAQGHFGLSNMGNVSLADWAVIVDIDVLAVPATDMALNMRFFEISSGINMEYKASIMDSSPQIWVNHGGAQPFWIPAPAVGLHRIVATGNAGQTSVYVDGVQFSTPRSSAALVPSWMSILNQDTNQYAGVALCNVEQVWHKDNYLTAQEVAGLPASPGAEALPPAPPVHTVGALTPIGFELVWEDGTTRDIELNGTVPGSGVSPQRISSEPQATTNTRTRITDPVSEWTEVVSVTTPAIGENLRPAPEPHVFTNVDHDSFQVTWDDTEEHDKVRQIEIDGVPFTNGTLESGGNFGFSGPNTTYQTRTRSVVMIGVPLSEWTEVVSITTLDVPPDTHDLEPTGATSLVVTWDTGELRDIALDQTYGVESQASGYVIQGLQPNTQYTVHTRDAGGASSWTDPVVATTLEGEPPVAYTYDLALDGEVAVTGLTGLTHTFTGLNSATTYQVKVRAVDPVYDGDNPVAPAAPVITVPTADGFTATWTAPA